MSKKTVVLKRKLYFLKTDPLTMCIKIEKTNALKKVITIIRQQRDLFTWSLYSCEHVVS